ncbi:hypothetical protein ARAM_001416 [Aspergillus rambellii]|uniref:Cytochrome P450 monooxygenase n=1 Tax=Aspergillus rambellii TaxID=308745 RepID=A0A0F8X6E3_9EURO|nr:hypothetical protein ARAM_001416 [Aspergillus rambellii]
MMIQISLSPWTATLLVILAYPIIRIIHNLYFHPLSQIPGPRSWAASRLPFIGALIRGTIVHDFQRLHAEYGPVVRIAPNEVTFAAADAWTDIFQTRPDQPQFLKDPLWWARQPGHPDSLLSAINPDKHAHMRRLLSPGFTPRALRAQEPFVQKYVNLLVERLQDLAKDTGVGSAEVDMTPWFNYTTFDIFGDLGFGESFDCLQHSRYHPWIAILFNSVKAASFVISARFYPLIQFVLLKCIPPSLRKVQRDHFQQIVDKVQRRLSWELQRPDFMSHLIDKNGELALPIGELNATFMILTTAGSETTATALTGTLNYLANERPALAQLEEEIRGAFKSFESITLDAVRNLPFLNAVIHEGLRLCPPVPWMLPRLVPEGGSMTPVSIQAYALNRDPNLFYKSSSFLPERWLPRAASDPTSPFFHDERRAVQPFSVGPRACLGQHLAWAEMRLILAKLIWTFDMASIEGKRVRWEDMRTYLLVDRKPVNVRITLREGAGV